MITKFICPRCHLIFETEGWKDEYNSTTYGPCFKYVASCPACGEESSEYRAQYQRQTSASDQPLCGAESCCCHK